MLRTPEMVRLPSTQFQLDFINAIGVGSPKAGNLPLLSVAPESEDVSDTLAVTQGTEDQIDWRAAHAALSKLREGLQPLAIERGLMQWMTPAPNKNFVLYVYRDGIQLSGSYILHCDKGCFPDYSSQVNWQLRGGSVLYMHVHELRDFGTDGPDGSQQGEKTLVMVFRRGSCSDDAEVERSVHLDGKTLAELSADYVASQFQKVSTAAVYHMCKQELDTCSGR